MPADDIRPFLFRHPVSATLHLCWAVWALYLTALLWSLTRGDPRRRLPLAVFGSSMVLLYTASGLYHAVPREYPALLEFCRRLDLSAICVLIAGTYTPLFAILLAGPSRRVLLALVWALAGLAAGCKWLLPVPAPAVNASLYVALGAVGLFGMPAVARVVGARPTLLALGGALLYCLGALCDALRWPVFWPGVVGPHEILHACDMAGTLVHTGFILRHVLPHRPTPPLPGPSSCPAATADLASAGLDPERISR